MRYGSEAIARATTAPRPGLFKPSLAPDQFAQAYAVLGVASAFLGRPDEARKDLEALRGVANQDGIGMARIHMAMREYDKALEAINRSPGAMLAITSLLGADYTGFNVPRLFIRAKSLYETGAIASARQAYDDLLKLSQLPQIGGVYWPCLFDRAQIALKDGDIALAIELLKKAIEVIEQQRSSIDTEAGRIGFVGNKQTVYGALIGLFVARGEAAQALDYVERAKARALVDMLAGKRDFSLPEGGGQRVQQLLAATETAEIAARDVAPTAEASSAVRGRVAATQQELAQAAPQLSALVSVKAANALSLQTLLPADETLVEYFYGSDGLFAFVVTREAISAHRLDGRGLEEDIAFFRGVIQAPEAARWREPAQKLHARLIAPIRDRLRTPNLLVIAHGALHYLPFGALVDGSEFLVQRHAIRLLPAATVLEYLQTELPDKPGILLALGNPDLRDRNYDLPFAQAEAEAVVKTMPRSRALLRADASRTAFRKYSADFRFIHIAGHGHFDAERPLASSLRLAPDGGDDGRLTVSDLYSMRIGAELVTLSACETGLGRIASGDDVVGLTRGFLYAGTHSIIASLWQVEDRVTGELMIALYQSMAKGLSKRDALRAAQLAQLGKEPHPFFWAAFQLTGSR